MIWLLLGTLNFVETGVLMWPATLLGNNIGRRCCRCWFEYTLIKRNTSGWHSVNSVSCLINNSIHILCFEILFLHLWNCYKYKSLFQGTGLDTYFSSPDYTMSDVGIGSGDNENNLDVIQCLIHWIGILKPILEFSVFR